MLSKMLKPLLIVIAAAAIFAVLGVPGLALAGLVAAFFVLRSAGPMRVSEMLLHAGVALLLLLGYGVALFLGLQVRPAYGTLGLVIVTALGVAYVWMWTRKRRREVS